MKRISGIIVLLVFVVVANGQVKEKVYNPSVDAKAELKKSIQMAQEQDKHILLQIGFNRCPWCIKLHHFIKDDPTIDSLIHADYVVQKVNYSRDNYNQELIEELAYPNRFGFPVIVVLDQDGKRIHTQNSVYLEEGKGYNRKTIIDFLQDWNKKALDPATYKKRK